MWYCTLDDGATAFTTNADDRMEAYARARLFVGNYDVARVPINVLSQGEWDDLSATARTPSAFRRRARPLQYLKYDSRTEVAHA